MTREDTRMIYTDGLEECIRCAMCTNMMANNRGCDGGCVVNESIYKKVLDVINERMLEQQPSEDCISRNEAIRVAEQGQIQGYEWQFKQLCKLPVVTLRTNLAETSQDCISRQAVIDTTICEDISCNECSFNVLEDGQPVCLLRKRIKNLPSVTPQQKVGKWIYEPRRRMIDQTDNGVIYREEMWCKCSECGADFGYIKNKDKYCKFCGTKMEVEQNG